MPGKRIQPLSNGLEVIELGFRQHYGDAKTRKEHCSDHQIFICVHASHSKIFTREFENIFFMNYKIENYWLLLPTQLLGTEPNNPLTGNLNKRLQGKN